MAPKIIGPDRHTEYLGHFASEKVLREGHNVIGLLAGLAAMNEQFFGNPLGILGSLLLGQKGGLAKLTDKERVF